jgi:pimeloyl-ACP methyl ester carboxylesterase
MSAMQRGAQARRIARAVAAAACALLLPACMFLGDSRDPIPFERIPAREAAPEHPLIVILPGLEDDAHVLHAKGVDDAIQRAWPTADLIITSTTYPYYRDNRLVRHLRREVIEPARKAGYREIWIAGGSMGGLGALMYEHEYPGDAAGLVLLSPYLGGTFLVHEIRDAGGVRKWDPGALPRHLTADDYKRQVWAMVKDWNESERPQRVWLICGDKDQMLTGVRLLAAQLPAGHYLERPGKHDWDFWPHAAEEIFAVVRQARDQPPRVFRAGQAGRGAQAPE